MGGIISRSDAVVAVVGEKTEVLPTRMIKWVYLRIVADDNNT
jgi:hypothetical protein